MDFLTMTFAMPVWALGIGLLVLVALAVLVCLGYNKYQCALVEGETLQQCVAEYEGQVQELSDSEEQYRELYAHAPVGIFRSLVDGSKFLVGNESAAMMWGYDTVEDFLAHCVPAQTYVDPENRMELIDTLKRNGVVDGFEILITRPDGRRKYLALSARLDTGSEFLEGAILDITARKQAERELKDGHLFLQTVMDTIPNPLYYRDRNSKIRHVNTAFESFMGIPRAEIMGTGIDEILPAEVSKELCKSDASMYAGQGVGMQRLEGWVRTRGGGQRDVVIQEGVVSDSANRQIGIVGVFTDFTDLKRTKSELANAAVTYKTIFDNSAEGIFTSLPEGRFLKVNPAMARLLGFDSPEDLVKSMTDIRTQMYASPVQRDEVLSILAEHGELVGHEIEAIRVGGERFWLSMSLTAIKDSAGGIAHIEGVAQDITERKGEEKELTRRATMDGLTGLPNRFVFDQTLDRMLAQARRSNEKVGVLFMDLDGFKAINDELGHEAGDMLLTEIGRRLLSRLRQSDVAARIGGDEFGLLLWNISGLEDIELVGNQVLETIGQPVTLQLGDEEYQRSVGVSIGASMSPVNGTDAATLIRRADKAMYAVKEGTKNDLKIAQEEG